MLEGLLLASVEYVVIPLVGVLLSALGVRAEQWIRARTKNENTALVLGRVQEAVFNIVRGIEQTLGKEFRKAAADGKLTAEEKQKLKSLAKRMVLEELGEKTLAELQKLFGIGLGQVSSIIDNRIESAVGALKQDKKSAAHLKEIMEKFGAGLG